MTARGRATAARSRAKRPLTYVASRLVDERLPHRARLVEVARAAHPDAEILDALTMFPTSADWLRAWPALLRRVERLVVIPGPSGEVGLGGAQEILDALVAGIPVEVATPKGLRPLRRLVLRPYIGDRSDVGVVAT